jgi:hypothetical protein
MDKKTFKHLFLKNVEEAVLRAEHIFAKKIPHDLPIELHGGGARGEIFSVDEALNYMFIEENIFYQIIDIGIVFKDSYKVFVRISAHAPSAFQDTWNSPIGNGPFKVLEPMNLGIDGVNP